MDKERRLDWFDLTQEEGDKLLILEAEREEALEKLLNNEPIRMKCLLCSGLSTRSQNGNSYNLPLHCNEVEGGFIRALVDFKQPNCGKDLPNLGTNTMAKIVSEKVECPVCKKKELEPSMASGDASNYDPGGHRGMSRSYEYLNHFECLNCGVMLSKKVLIWQAFTFLKKYLKQHGMTE